MAAAKSESDALVGKAAPTFSLPSTEGGTVALKDLKGKRAVLYFYPRDMTPGCTRESCDFRDQQALFAKHNTVVFGVSTDGLDSHEKFIAQEKLNFPLLSDKDHKVAEAFGAWGEKTNYGKTTQGLIRSTFVIDEKGKVAKAWRSVKVDGHVEQVLEFVKSMKG